MYLGIEFYDSVGKMDLVIQIVPLSKCLQLILEPDDDRLRGFLVDSNHR